MIETSEHDPTTKFFAAVGTYFFAIPLAILGLLPALALNAFVFMKAWDWFLPELFGVRAIGWAGSLAILMVWRAFLGGKTIYKGHEANLAASLSSSYLGPLWVLLLCWCLRAALNAGWLSF